MSDLKRIDIEEAAKSFVNNHIIPHRWEYVSNDGSCGCLLYAVAAMSLGRSDADQLINEALKCTLTIGKVIGDQVGMEPDYIDGLDAGFTMKSSGPRRGSNSYRSGFNDGRAVAAIVFGDVLSPVGGQ